MNAVTPNIPAAAPCSLQNATRSWRLKRTQIIETFAEVEFAVTETLNLLSDIDSSSKTIKIEPTMKARLTQLSDLIGSGGCYAKQGHAILEPLRSVQNKVELRNLLCHGQVIIYADSAGKWIARIRMMTVTKGVAILTQKLLTEEDVSEALKAMKSNSKTLVNRLRQFQNNLNSRKKVTPSALPAQVSH